MIATETTQQEPAEKEEMSTLEKIRNTVKEDTPKPTSQISLQKLLGGDLLNGDTVRRQIWLIVLVTFFVPIYIAARYQCQQDIIEIDKLEKELAEAKYKAMSSSSELTERCRESHLLKMLQANNDSLIRPSELPPYKINIPEE
ncbi:MAG: hypothetical protein J6Q93_00685 [Prevotella sp.]|nr:hypothetical protein [Prevotella sp.]